MYIIGLTGGIGSGKTMASGAFTHLGVPVIDLDKIAKNLTKKGSKGYNEIVKYFYPIFPPTKNVEDVVEYLKK